MAQVNTLTATKRLDSAYQRVELLGCYRVDFTQDELRQVARIFLPRAMREMERIRDRNGRFVHYTTAEVAFKIIRDRSVWMRNSMTMNDFSEIQYGIDCLAAAWAGEAGAKFKAIVEAEHAGLWDQLEAQFNSWIPQFRSQSFLTCLSEHLDQEDAHGRLSMWRAYGGRTGVALVMKNTPFMAETDLLKAYSSPVAYFSAEQFSEELNGIADAAGAAPDLFRRLGYQVAMSMLFTMLRFSVLCTKHPGFHEEREWRIIYSPTFEQSDAITGSIEIINGIPQHVHKIPLKSDPDKGLHGAAIPDLLDRVIIGPTDNQASLYLAFVSALQDAGVEDAQSRVTVSGIPLRY